MRHLEAPVNRRGLTLLIALFLVLARGGREVDPVEAGSALDLWSALNLHAVAMEEVPLRTTAPVASGIDGGAGAERRSRSELRFRPPGPREDLREIPVPDPGIARAAAPRANRAPVSSVLSGRTITGSASTAGAGRARLERTERAGPGELTDPVGPTEPQEILLELRIGRLVRRTVPAYDRDGATLLPVGDLLEMGEVDFTQDTTGTLRAVLHPGRRRVVLQPGAGVVTKEGRESPAPPQSLLLEGGELFVSAELLEELFDLVIRTDRADLTATVMNPRALPLGRRLAREARWRSLRAGAGVQEPGYALGLGRGALGGAVLDWSVSSTLERPEQSTDYRAGLGARLWDGSLRLSARSLGTIRSGRHRIDATYQLVRPEGSWLRQVRLGDDYATGPRLRAMRGVALSNAPFIRSSYFGTDEFEGRVGPGWDVELRRSGRPVDVTRADEEGAFALDIPLRYGNNPIQVAAFGPHGEVVTTERLVVLARDRLPAETFEWGVSGGACRSDRCEGTANLDLRYGLSDRWTIRAGMDGFSRDTLSNLVQPYVDLSGALSSSLQIGAEVLHDGFFRGRGTFAPSPDFRARAAHTRFSNRLDAPVLHDARRRSTTEADVFVRPLPSVDRFFLRGSMVRQALETDVLTRWQAVTSFQVRSVRLEGGLRREVTERVDGGAVRADDFQVGALTALLPFVGRRSLWARGEVEALEGRSLHRVQGRVAHQITPGSRLEVGAGWRRDHGSELTLSFTADLAQLRSITQAFSPDGASPRVRQVTRGTVQWNDATGGLTFGSGPGLERGGLSGYVFLDRNGNGVRDEGETPLENVRVIAGGRSIRTDAGGRYATWDLAPFQHVRVRVDSTSIPNPTWVPTGEARTVKVPPASYGRLDLPVTPSQELWGRVVRGEGGDERPVARVELELVDRQTGAVRAFRTFADGEFYLMGVTPGSYDLQVAPDALRGLDLEPEVEGRRLTVEPEGDGGDLHGITIRLVPVRGEAASDGDGR